MSDCASNKPWVVTRNDQTARGLYGAVIDVPRRQTRSAAARALRALKEHGGDAELVCCDLDGETFGFYEISDVGVIEKLDGTVRPWRRKQPDGGAVPLGVRSTG